MVISASSLILLDDFFDAGKQPPLLFFDSTAAPAWQAQNALNCISFINYLKRKSYSNLTDLVGLEEYVVGSY